MNHCSATAERPLPIANCCWSVLISTPSQPLILRTTTLSLYDVLMFVPVVSPQGVMRFWERVSSPILLPPFSRLLNLKISEVKLNKNIT